MMWVVMAAEVTMRCNAPFCIYRKGKKGERWKSKREAENNEAK
jgi:hypothetical protein